MSSKMILMLGMCGLMVVMASAQAQGELMVADETAAASAAGATERAAGLHFGPLQVIPELNASYFHDSNPTYAEEHSKGVTGYRVEPILDFILTGNGWTADLRGWFSQQHYFGSSTNVNRVADQNYGENASFAYVTPQDTKITFNESYQYWNGNSFVAANGPSGMYNASFGDRQLFTSGGEIDTALGEKTRMHAGVSYSDLWYDNPALFGWQDVGGSLGFSHKLSDISDALLDFGADNQTSDGGSDGDSQSYRALAGFGSRLTPKTSYKAEVGLMGYQFNNGSKSAVAPTYSLSGVWEISERLSAHVSGSSAYQPSESDTNNYTVVDILSTGLTFKPIRRLTTTLDATYRRESYGISTAAGEKRHDNQADLSSRATYRVYHYTDLFVGAEFCRNASSIDNNSYSRLYLETGVDIRF